MHDGLQRDAAATSKTLVPRPVVTAHTRAKRSDERYRFVIDMSQIDQAA